MVWWCCLTPMFCHLPSSICVLPAIAPLTCFWSPGQSEVISKLDDLSKSLSASQVRVMWRMAREKGCWSDTQGAPEVILFYKAIDSDIPEFPRKRYRAHRVPQAIHTARINPNDSQVLSIRMLHHVASRSYWFKSEPIEVIELRGHSPDLPWSSWYFWELCLIMGMVWLSHGNDHPSD